MWHIASYCCPTVTINSSLLAPATPLPTTHIHTSNPHCRSLGFMTPFPIERMDWVLARTTSAEHGFPLMLRHRLQVGRSFLRLFAPFCVATIGCRLPVGRPPASALFAQHPPSTPPRRSQGV